MELKWKRKINVCLKPRKTPISRRKKWARNLSNRFRFFMEPKSKLMVLQWNRIPWKSSIQTDNVLKRSRVTILIKGTILEQMLEMQWEPKRANLFFFCCFLLILKYSHISLKELIMVVASGKQNLVILNNISWLLLLFFADKIRG